MFDFVSTCTGACRVKNRPYNPMDLKLHSVLRAVLALWLSCFPPALALLPQTRWPHHCEQSITVNRSWQIRVAHLWEVERLLLTVSSNPH